MDDKAPDSFTEQVRNVIELANQEAQRCGQGYIGTEHVLLGLLQERRSVAANLLSSHNADLHRVRREIEKLGRMVSDTTLPGLLPVVPKVKRAVAYAAEEAEGLEQQSVGTEHLLLGLLREDESLAVQILLNLGVKLEEVRTEVRAVLRQCR